MGAQAADRKNVSEAKLRRGRKETRRQRIGRLVTEIERRLDVENSKVSIGDFIRLLQLERELEEEEQPREIVVTWKDPAEERCELK